MSYLVTGPPEVGAAHDTMADEGPNCTAVTLVGVLGGAVCKDMRTKHPFSSKLTYLE